MIAYAPFQSVADRGSVVSLQAGVIVDTQVLVDFAVRTRRRHGLALRFFQHMQSTNTPVLIPGHAVFEYQSAFQAAMRERQAKLAPQARARNINNVILYPVAVDQALVAACKRLKLPYLRAGDLVFLALAAVLRRPLVTEDRALFKKAAALGLVVSRTAGFLGEAGA